MNYNNDPSQGQQNQQPGYQQPGYQQPGYQQPGYQQPNYQQPAYQQPVQKKGLSGGAITAIVLGAVAVFTVLTIVLVSLFSVPSPITESETGPEIGSGTESELPPATLVGQYYYSSANIPDADIQAQALVLFCDLLRASGEDLSNIRYYAIEPSSIYADPDLQESIMWSCYSLSEKIHVENIDGSCVAREEMDLRGMRMFGIDITEFNIPKNQGYYPPYFLEEYDVYGPSAIGGVEGYCPEGGKVEIVEKTAESVRVRAHILATFYNQEKDELEDFDCGMQELCFAIKNDGGVYYLQLLSVGNQA